MTTRRRWLAGIAAVALVIFTAGTVLGYAGEVAGSVTVYRPAGKLKCNVNITVKATVLDAAGKPIAGQPVKWTWKSRVSTGDKILDAKSTTNSNGVAKTTVKLACVPGSRVIRAQADNARGTAVLNLTAGGLPEHVDPSGGAGRALAAPRDRHAAGAAGRSRRAAGSSRTGCPSAADVRGTVVAPLDPAPRLRVRGFG